MREAHALISYKAAKKRHWDEEEEDDEEDCATDDSLWLWTAEMGDQEEKQSEIRSDFQLVFYSFSF